MLKKISLVLVMLFAIVAFSVPATAECGSNDFLEQEQFGISLLLTGVVINPVDIGASEYYDGFMGNSGSEFDLYWGGLTIDILALQIIGQRQSIFIPGRGGFAMGCQSNNSQFSLVSDGLTIKMSQSGSQFGMAAAEGHQYW